MRPYFSTCLLLLMTAGVAGAAEDYVWWEAEDATEHNFANNAFSPDSYGKNRALLSDADWLHHRGEVPEGGLRARYKLKLPAEKKYHLWTRKYWKHGPFEWRFGMQPWRACGRDCGLVDNTVLSPHIGLNWVYLGAIQLPAGEQDFELRLTAPEGGGGTGCFDCFLLTPHDFRPRGKLKPGEPAEAAPEGWWAYDAGPRLPTGDGTARRVPLLDLRSLNETQAGATGFVHADGARLLRGDGEAIRFWGVNAAANILELENPQLDQLAERLARSGVNLVRIRAAVYDPKAKDPTVLLPRRLERIHYWVHALKKRGLYTALSFYSPAWFNVKDHYALPGYTRRPKFDRKPEALLYIDARMQSFYRAWASALLTTPSPYGGLPLARDPALALLEIVHEDSLFAWTFNAKNIPPEQRAKLEAAYAQWLAGKYGNASKALMAWGAEAKHARDAADAEPASVALLDIWHLTRKGLGHASAGKRRRVQDQARFMTEHLQAFHRDTAAFFKTELSYGGLITTGHMPLDGESALELCAQYAAAPLDVATRGGWYIPPHRGLRKEFAVVAGDVFADLSLLRHPRELPLGLAGRTPAGAPVMLSEINWLGPNRLRAEAPLVASSVASLQGIDGVAWFALNGPFASNASEKFPLNSPGMLGQFPAAALQYRRGDVQTGQVLAKQLVTESKLWSLSGVQFDEKKEAFAALAGRTSVGVRDRPVTQPLDLTPFYDAEKKTLRSASGELQWDFARGVFRVDTPRSQAVAGYFKDAGNVQLGEVRIEAENEYACIHLISLDGVPLVESKKMLLQCYTREEPAGFETRTADPPRNTDGTLPDPATTPPYHRIEQVGHFPILIERSVGRVHFQHAPARATVLDEAGRARGPADLNGQTLNLPADAMYVLIER